MKKVIYPLIVLFAMAACKKENHTSLPGNGTIVMNESATAYSGSVIPVSPFTNQDSTTVFGLMNSNTLSTNGFVFYAYQSYNAYDQNNQMAFFQIATAKQVSNGLPVFFEDITFGFENGKLNGPPPASQFIVGAISLDNKPSQSLQTLRSAFIKADNADEAKNISIQDSTLVAQLGYYNLNINEMASGGAPNYIKVWSIHPQHSSLPSGYYRDDTGVQLFFTPLTHSGLLAP